MKWARINSLVSKVKAGKKSKEWPRTSQKFSGTRNGLLHQGHRRYTRQHSCPWSGFVHHFSEAYRQPAACRSSWKVLTSPYDADCNSHGLSHYSYPSWGAELFGQGLTVAHAPSTHPAAAACGVPQSWSYPMCVQHQTLAALLGNPP